MALHLNLTPAEYLRFRPNPDYAPHTIESRIVHSMTGDLWIDTGLKRLVRVEGHLQNNVDFGFDLLSRLNKGGWFLMQRNQVSAMEWKTQRMEIHLTGSAMIFKTIGRETSEVRSGFISVPAGLNLAQAVELMRTPNIAEAQSVRPGTPTTSTDTRR